MATSLWPHSMDFLTRKKIGRRHLRRLSVCLVFLIVTAPAFSQSILESRQIYELVANATMESLPPLLRSWFADRDAFKASVFTGQEDLVSIMVDSQQGQQHFTWLQEPSPGQEKNRQKTKHPFRFTIATVKGQAHTLPEMIQKQYTALVEAFRKDDESLAVSMAGLLMHEVIDASLPSHVAIVKHKWQGPSATHPDKRIEKIVFHESKVLENQHERFVFEVRVWPERLQDERDVSRTILDSLEKASSAGSSIYNHTESAMHSSSSQYEGVVLLVRGQLEAATWLSGSLIRSAWHEAGSPMSTSHVQPSPENTITQSTSVTNFVGSKQSKIFHRHTCPYVKRIKPANFVYFDSVLDAQNVGRKACKTCKPTSDP